LLACKCCLHDDDDKMLQMFMQDSDSAVDWWSGKLWVYWRDVELRCNKYQPLCR